ncbi:MAG: metabolite traffic protein EboE [Planctomycetaceae bacterium]|nr:metabolite traffic protein EboE [Planctomycetaceae bacterium]
MTFATLPLSYCTNVHPGRTVAEVISGLIEHTADVRRRVDFPMAAGLWLSARVADELSGDQAALERLAQTLWQHDLCCYTLNTFPFGDFHSERVKEQVYLPDWSSPDRVRYTQQCAALLAQLLPANGEGSLSTVPLAGRMNPRASGFLDACWNNLIEFALYLRQIHETTGRKIRLAIEPEPFCEMDRTLETTLPLFEQLFAVAEAAGHGSLVREYIGLCFDVCHQAVVFEDVANSIGLIDQAGIRINKVHITNAVELLDPANNVAGREMLCQFVEPRYLHQTYAQTASGQVVFREDLKREDILRVPPDEFMQARSWRVHFHVPIFAESIGPLSTTRPDLIAALNRVAELEYAPQLEVETYTWPVMPNASPDRPPETISERIANELISTAELLSDY